MQIRISVAVRCRIMVDDRYALIISLNGLKRGERSLAPVGGGVKTTETGKRYLINELSVDPATFEKGYDLRFQLPNKQLEDFREWLRFTTELEKNAAGREFHDEIVVERNLLTEKMARRVTFAASQQHEGPMRLWSYLGGCMRFVDSYGFEWIYDATLPPAAKATLLRAAEQPGALIELVTAKEIRQGRSKFGSTISDWTRFLL